MQTDTAAQSNPEESPAEPPPAGVASPQMEMCIINPTGGYRALIEFTDFGVKVAEDITLDEYQAGLSQFKWMMRKMDIGFSQYVGFGYAKFGKLAVDGLLSQLEFDMPEIKAAIDIESVPMEIRHSNLGADHYIVLARSGLKKAQLKKWSDTASAQNLTPNQLKASIAAGEVVTTTAARSSTTGIISVNGVRQDFEIWLRRVNGLAGILTLEKAAIDDIKVELQPIYELYVELLKLDAHPKAKRKPATANKKVKK